MWTIKHNFIFIVIFFHISFFICEHQPSTCFQKCHDDECRNGLLEKGNHVVRSSERSCVVKYHVHCHFWNLGRCTKYKTVNYFTLRCENGYRRYKEKTSCDYAICNRKTNLEGACKSSLIIKNRDGTYKTEYSEGDCQKPNDCVCKSNNFYGKRGTCEECPKIPNCHEVQCTSDSNYTCVYCHGEVKPNRFFRAYTWQPVPKKCQKACSWRADSTRCFPGHCENELASKCKCIQGFTGHHCHIMQDFADIKYSMCTLKKNRTEKIDNPSDPNFVSSTEVIWTKKVDWSTAETKWEARYVLNESLTNFTRDHYVQNFSYGIVSATTTLQYKSGTDNKDEYLRWNCPNVSKDDPLASPFTCQKKFSLQSYFNFKHNDTCANLTIYHLFIHTCLYGMVDIPKQMLAPQF